MKRLLVILIISLLAIEAVLHVTLPAPPSRFAEFVNNRERLFYPHWSQTYDISGLYAGAETVTIRATADRFIAPQGDRAAPRQVLFLGGSTTESIYVAEDQRYVARLNSPTVATYNAGQSGANTLDKLETFRYLTARGWYFDLVVIATHINDFSTLTRLGDDFTPPTYHDALLNWYEAQEAPNWLVANSRLVRIFSQASQANALVNVTDTLTRQGQSEWATNLVDLVQCPTYRGVSLDTLFVQYQERTQDHLRLLHNDVQATGAALMVVNELTNYAALPEGFVIDLRHPRRDCGGDTGLTLDSIEALHNQLGAHYLTAGHAVGAQTFDLRAALGDTFNGPQGGRYTYDGMHFTPDGSALVADVLRSVALPKPVRDVPDYEQHDQ